ncbi:MAG: response regulator transcription factor [Thermomicrobiales bacterium]
MMASQTRVLVVDDDPDILDAVRFTLEDEGFIVTTTEKGEYAENLHDGNGGLPDLILLDVLLSGTDGRTICHHLKNRADTKHIPIIMISAHPDARESAVEVGADAFLAKPWDIDELIATVRQFAA